MKIKNFFAIFSVVFMNVALCKKKGKSNNKNEKSIEIDDSWKDDPFFKDDSWKDDPFFKDDSWKDDPFFKDDSWKNDPFFKDDSWKNDKFFTDNKSSKSKKQ